MPLNSILLLVGGGQDREQLLASRDLVETKGPVLRDAMRDGLVALAVCGGYQLFGEYYRDHTGAELRGIAVLPAYTTHPGEDSRRCIGNIVTMWKGKKLVGFENHGGRTYLHDTASRARYRCRADSGITVKIARKAHSGRTSTAPISTARCCQRIRLSPTT